MKLFRRRMAVFAAIIAVAIFMMNIAIDNPYSHKLFRAAINEKLKANTNIQVDFKSIRLSLMPLGAHLYAVTILATNDQDKHAHTSNSSVSTGTQTSLQPNSHLSSNNNTNASQTPEATNGQETFEMMRIPHLSMRVSLWSLFLGTPKLSLVKIDSIVVKWPPPMNLFEVIKNEDRNKHITLHEKKKKLQQSHDKLTWPPDFDIPIETVEITNSTLLWEPNTTMTPDGIPAKPVDTHTSITGIDITLKNHSWDNISFNVRLQNIAPTKNGKPILIGTHGSVSGELKRGELKNARLELNSDKIALSGTISGGLRTSPNNDYIKSLSLQIKTESTIDLKLLDELFDLPNTFGSSNNSSIVDLKFSFDSDTPPHTVFSGKTVINAGSINGIRLFDSSLMYRSNQDQLDFRKLRININGKSLSNLHGRVRFTDDIQYFAEGSLKNLELSQIIKIVGNEFETVNFDLSSKNIRLSGQGLPFRMTVSGLGDLKSIRIAKNNSKALPPNKTQSKPTFNHRLQSSEQQSQYDPPSCTGQLTMEIDTTKMDLALDEGICRHVRNPQEQTNPASPKPSPTLSETLPHQLKSPAEYSDVSSKLNLSGEINFENRSMDLRVQTTQFDLSLANYYLEQPFTGRGKISSRIHGPFAKIVVDNSLKLTKFSVLHRPLGNITAQVSSSGSLISWRNLTAQFTKKTKIFSKKGSLSLENLNLTTQFEAQSLDPKLIRSVLGDPSTKDSGFTFGIESLSGTISGPLRTPGLLQGKLDIKAYDIYTKTIKLADTLSASITSTDRGWEGQNFEYSIDDFHLHGNFKHERVSHSLKIQGSKRMIDGDLQEQSPDSVPHSLNLTTSESTIKFLQRIGLSPDDKIDISVASVRANKRLTHSRTKAPRSRRIRQLQSLPVIGKSLKAAQIDGELVLTGEIGGSLAHIDGTISGRVQRLVILGAPIAPIRVSGFINGPKIDLTLDHSGNSLKGRISANLSLPGTPYEWYFSFKQFDLRPLTTRIFFEDPRNYFYLTADWISVGTFANWWKSTGEVNIRSITARYVVDSSLKNRELFFKSKAPVTIQTDSNGWAFKGKPLVITNEYLKLKLDLPSNKPPDNVHLKLTGSASAKALEEFIPQIESAAGSVNLSAVIEGSMSNPKFGIEVISADRPTSFFPSWKPLSVGITDLRPALKKIELKVNYKENKLVIEKFVANKGNGNLEVHGSLDLKEGGDTNSNIRVNLNKVAVSYPVPMLKSFDSKLDGVISISGSSPPFKVAGDIQIISARSIRHLNIRNEIVDAFQKGEISGEVNQGIPMLNLELNVAANSSITIRNQTIDAVLSSNLRIGGTDITPEVSGQIEVVRGTFTYQQEFDITRGIISFDDPIKSIPTIDFLAITDVPPYKVSVLISGKASKPTIEFSVDPPTQEDGKPITKFDTLVLLSRGKIPKGQSATNAEGVVTTEAANFVINKFQEPLEKLLDMSGQTLFKQVYVDIYASEQDGSPLPRANAPLNIGKDVEVIASGDRDSTGISVEYPLHEAITLSGKYKKHHNSDLSSSESSEDTGIDLKFRFSIP